MPRINDYNAPEISDQGGSLENTSSLTAPGEIGRSISNFGQTISGLGDIAYQRASQEEVSDLNAKFAEARSDWSQKIDEQIRNGTVDPTKTKEDFQNYINKMDDGIQTREGRNFFERQGARLGGQVVKSAAHGKAVVAGEKAVQDYTTALNLNSNQLSQHPEDFEDVLGSSTEAVDAQIQSGVIDQKKGLKLKEETGRELAKSAIRGWAKLDPDKADEVLNKGVYDKYLDGEDKQSMTGFVNQQRVAKDIEQRRAQTAQEKAMKLKSEAWQQSALPDLAKGSLETQKILDSPMDANEKIRWLKLQEEAAKDSAKTDPRVKNDITRRILLPDDDPQKITGIADMAPFVGKGLSVTDTEQLNGFIQKLPEDQNMKDNRKRLMDLASAKLVKKDPMLGISDPDGEYNMSQFQVALQNAEADMRKDKKPLKDLYDPNSKDYFGNKIGKYQSSPEEILAKMSGQSQMGAIHGAEGQPPPAADEMVSVVSPKGQKGKVKKSALKYWKDQGFREQ